MKLVTNGLFVVAILLTALHVNAMPRVALMDFSVDDNSYRSTQQAADFTSLLQVQLADEPGLEWVERAQLDRARQELELSVMENMGSYSPMRLGKWAKADWMVSGQFSLDDKNQRTLFLEITDLQHADVLASRMITFPDAVPSQFQIITNQVNTTAEALRQLLSEAGLREQQTAGKILVASLFLADVTGREFGRGFSSGDGILEQGFNEALERTMTTNNRIRLIHFPKAYRSTEESEMVLDGLVESDRNAWQQTADLYVWGTYSVTGEQTAGKPDQQIEIKLHLWDGVSRPTIINEELPCDYPGDIPAEQAEAALNRLVNQVIAHAQKCTTQTNSASIRKDIAQSLVDTYNQMTSGFQNRTELGLNDPGKFLQAAHMLETACFFDPDNASARVLYVTCRWGWWMDFTFKVKNEFWSKWRRSEAWGKYVNRFGLKPVAVELPFPYQQEGGIPAVYLGSLNDVLEMFPQWHSADEMALEDKWQQQGVHTWLMEAEGHGFPKEMPHDLAMKWKTEAESELWQRLTKIAEFMGDEWTLQEKMPSSFLSIVVGDILDANQSPATRLGLLEKIWPADVKYAKKYGKQWANGLGQLNSGREQQLIDLCTQAGQPERGKELLAMLTPNQPAATAQPVSDHPSAPNPFQASSQMVPTPSWARDIQMFYSMFRLFPPNALPLQIQPDMQEFRFPSQFDVQSVDQMDFLDDQLLILAMDERSAPSSDSNPDVSAEMLDKHDRLWVLKPGKENPTLYEADLFRRSVSAFLLNDSRLWVAGETTGCLDLTNLQFQKFGLAEGFDQTTSYALGFGGGHIFAAGDNFKISMFNAALKRWSNLSLPQANFFSGTGYPLLLAGNKQQLGFVAGSVLIHDSTYNTWTNLANLNSPQHILADDSGFWFGGRDGLHFYDLTSKSIKHWNAPITFNGLFVPMMGHFLTGNDTMPAGNLDAMDEQIQGLMRKLQEDRAKKHAEKRKSSAVANPLHLDWRVQGDVTALANDGDFLWVGIGNFFGNYLLLLHKPSESLVAYCPMQARDKISSIAISKTAVWIGTAYGDHKLLKLPKSSFLSIPQSSWVGLAISPNEREQLIRGMSIRDQAMYAFYAGDDPRVASLLGDIDPDKATLEQMFLLAFSYDALGLDKPDLARTWFENIISRYPDSVWAKTAQTALSENEQNHKAKEHQETLSRLLAKYDLKHDGVLDPDEKRAMEQDPDYQHEMTTWDTGQFDVQLKAIMQKYDVNRNGQLDRDELENLRARVNIFSQATPEILAAHKMPEAPLISKNFPTVSAILQKYDTNRDGGLEIEELKYLAEDIQKDR